MSCVPVVALKGAAVSRPSGLGDLQPGFITRSNSNFCKDGVFMGKPLGTSRRAFFLEIPTTVYELLVLRFFTTELCDTQMFIFIAV